MLSLRLGTTMMNWELGFEEFLCENAEYRIGGDIWSLSEDKTPDSRIDTLDT